jgi:hypothetical protein
MPTDQPHLNARVEYEGRVWHIDGKTRKSLDGHHGTLTVYRVLGDVTDEMLLDRALQLHADSLGLDAVVRAGTATPKSPKVRRPAKVFK